MPCQLARFVPTLIYVPRETSDGICVRYYLILFPAYYLLPVFMAAEKELITLKEAHGRLNCADDPWFLERVAYLNPWGRSHD